MNRVATRTTSPTTVPRGAEERRPRRAPWLLLAGLALLAAAPAHAFTITASSDTNGVIVPAGAVEADSGSAQSFTLTPSPGYRVRDVKVDGVSVGAVSEYVFPFVDAAHTIVASFSPIPYPLVVLRADSSNGATRWPIPSSSGPWRDLRNGHDAVTTNFLWDCPSSGWAGAGSHESPYRLKWAGREERVVIPAGSIPELQSIAPVTAAVWFQTSDNGNDPAYRYVMEWVDSTGGGGMSIAVHGGTLGVYLNGWVDVASVAPMRWTHIVVAKELDECRVYVNGTRVYTGTRPYIGRQVSGLGVGTSQYETLENPDYRGGHYYRGAIAQVEVWHGALTDDEADARFLADQATYLPDPHPPLPTKLVELRADQADGSAPYPAPGAATPWRDLAGTPTDAALSNFGGTPGSGWAGTGTLGDPNRLEYDGVDDIVTLGPRVVSELQDPLAYTTSMWFKTPSDVTTQQFLTEWLEYPGLHGGMSLDITGGNLRVFIENGEWQTIAPVLPNTWYHVAAAKQPGSLKVYVNGATRYVGASPWIGPQTSPIAIGGAVYNGPPNYTPLFRGALGGYALWNGALDADAALAAFLADSTRFCDYQVTASADTGGTIAPSGALETAQHTSLPFTLTPATGYVVADVQVDGVSVGPVLGFTLGDIVANHTVAASFAPGYYILADASAGGTIVPSGRVTVAPGDTAKFVIGAKPGYRLVDVKVDGVSVGPVANYRFDGVQAAHTIHVDCVLNAVQVTVPNGGESYLRATHVQAQWSTVDPTVVSNVDLAYTLDDGAHWTTIASAMANTGSYDWTLPDSTSSRARFRVTAHDTSGNVSSDVSDGRFLIHGVATGVGDGPHVLSLAGAWPNPAIDRFQVAFSLASAERATLELIDTSGRRVREADLTGLGPGPHRVGFDTGRRLPSGVYLVRLTQGGRRLTAKVALMP